MLPVGVGWGHKGTFRKVEADAHKNKTTKNKLLIYQVSKFNRFCAHCVAVFSCRYHHPRNCWLLEESCP